jgi:aconitate hydratase
MLGQPVYFLTPDVVGFELTGRLREGVTATDLVLTVTEMLRKRRWWASSSSSSAKARASLSLPDRATIGNMAPEYGATMGFFPVDEKTDYFKGTGRTKAEIEAFEAYFRAQGCLACPAGEIDYSHVVTLDLGTWRPAWPAPSARRTASSWAMWPQVRSCSAPGAPTASTSRPTAGLRHRGLRRRRRVRRRPKARRGCGGDGGKPKLDRATRRRRCPAATKVLRIGNGDVLIAAITSCTNTSNPSVMLAAGLLAKKAVQAG